MKQITFASAAWQNKGKITRRERFLGEMHRQAAKAGGIRYRVSRRPSHGHTLTRHERALNRLRSATRARGEHAFRVIKNLWDFSKVRYRGFAKNTARLFTMFALTNLYSVRRRLLPLQETCRC